MRSVGSKLAIATGVLALAVLLIAALPSPASASDKDCSDFATQRAAQFYFLKHGGPRRDPDRLDADHDGIACEDNPCPCYYKKRLPRRALLDGESTDRRLWLNPS
jgi:excalibur calcium-binding domain-containing protein